MPAIEMRQSSVLSYSSFFLSPYPFFEFYMETKNIRSERKCKKKETVIHVKSSNGGRKELKANPLLCIPVYISRLLCPIELLEMKNLLLISFESKKKKTSLVFLDYILPGCISYSFFPYVFPCHF